MNILALDPATTTGWALKGDAETDTAGLIEYGPNRIVGKETEPRVQVSGTVRIGKDSVTYGTVNLHPQTKTKVREGETKAYRLLHMYAFMEALPWVSVDKVVMESAAEFTRGKAATEVAHQLRAIIELEALRGSMPLVAISPTDVKRFALGKGTGEKDEMIAAAAAKYGYEGEDDNEADALHIMAWYLENHL